MHFLRCAVISPKHIDFTIATVSFQRFKHAIRTLFSKGRCFGMNVWYTLPAKRWRKRAASSLHPIIVPIQANVTPASTANYWKNIFNRFAVELLRSKLKNLCLLCRDGRRLLKQSCERLQLHESLEYWNCTRDLASDNLMGTFDKSWQNPDNPMVTLDLLT